MNILMVGPDSQAKGGMATVISNFKQYYQNENDQLFFLNSWTTKRSQLSGLQSMFKLRHLIKQENIDIVHFHVAQKGSFYRKSILMWLTPKSCHKLFHMHASQFDTFYEKANFFMKIWIHATLNKLDTLVVLSKEWEAYYRTITRTNINIIENAVAVPPQNAYQPNQNFIVTLGKLGKRKGSYDILEVARQLETAFPYVKFMLYGDGEVEEVRQRIAEMGLKNIKVGSWLNEEAKQEVLAHTALHFLPSYQEGLPMSILETMALGIPNLSTTVGGIPQVIDSEKNGYLTYPGDINCMVESLISFLQDDNIQKRLSNQAHLTIASRFSFDSYLKKWKILYQKMGYK